MKRIMLIIFSVLVAMTIIAIVGYKSLFWTGSPRTELVPEETEKTTSFNDIKHLYIRSDIPVLVKSSNDKNITVTNPAKTELVKDSSTLNVIGTRHWHKQIKVFSLHTSKTRQDSLIITIPKKQLIRSLAFHVEVSNNKLLNAPVIIRNIKTNNLSFHGDAHLLINDSSIARELSIENDFGKTEITKNSINYGSVSNECGSIRLSHNQFENLDVSDEAGTVKFDNQKVGQKLVASSELGSVQGTINDQKNANISASTEIGGTSLFGHSKHKYTGLRKPPVKYHLSTEIGNVKIQ